MQFTATTTIQLFVAALITSSAGAAVKRDCPTQIGQIQVGNSGYLSAVATDAVFTVGHLISNGTIFQFQVCGNGPFELTYMRDGQSAGLVGAVLFDTSTGPDSVDLDTPNWQSFLAQVPHSEYGATGVYNSSTWVTAPLHSQSTIWNYNSTTGVINAIWVDANGTVVVPEAVIFDTELLWEGGPVSPVALIASGNSYIGLVATLTWLPITQATSTSSSLPPSMPTSSPVPTQPLYAQCGGETWTGSRQCGSGLVCISEGEYYSQCYTRVPNAGGSGDGQPTQVIYGQCGGTGWTGITECAPGLVCTAQDTQPDAYAQCLTLDPQSVPSD